MSQPRSSSPLPVRAVKRVLPSWPIGALVLARARALQRLRDARQAGDDQARIDALLTLIRVRQAYRARSRQQKTKGAA
jgi:hypothetical protein